MVRNTVKTIPSCVRRSGRAAWTRPKASSWDLSEETLAAYALGGPVPFLRAVASSIRPAVHLTAAIVG